MFAHGMKPVANAWSSRTRKEKSMGRPLMRECELRQRIDVYLAADERDEITRRAAEARLPVSAFIRRAAMGQRVRTVPTGNATRWASLSRLSANLNQIARHLNSGRVDGIDAGTVEALLGEVRALRLELMGAES